MLGLSIRGRLSELLGADGKDASGGLHLSLNTHPVPVVTADRAQLRELHAKATANPDLLVVAFSEVARRSRDYEEYLVELSRTPAEDIDYLAIAVFGPRNRVTALTRRVPPL
ncbi:hypothetical protein GCM10009682_34280 [Luedemannella flava]|uniref:DUF2000 domain-containing protein n=1 Tax=Luedemannella flava TaxID=349316 RepID=A0ABN2M4S1_9ACTN